MRACKLLVPAHPERQTWRSDSDPFWLFLAGSGRTCDAQIDVFKDPAQIGLTLRVKVHDPAWPFEVLDYQVMPHDLREFARFLMRKISQAEREAARQRSQRRA